MFLGVCGRCWGDFSSESRSRWSRWSRRSRRTAWFEIQKDVGLHPSTLPYSAAQLIPMLGRRRPAVVHTHTHTGTRPSVCVFYRTWFKGDPAQRWWCTELKQWLLVGLKCRGCWTWFFFAYILVFVILVLSPSYWHLTLVLSNHRLASVYSQELNTFFKK